MVMWRMRIECWIRKATNTHSEYVILVNFPRQQWLNERASVLRFMYIACFVSEFVSSYVGAAFAMGRSPGQGGQKVSVNTIYKPKTRETIFLRQLITERIILCYNFFSKHRFHSRLFDRL